jgi:hypothetical protein
MHVVTMLDHFNKRMGLQALKLSTHGQIFEYKIVGAVSLYGSYSFNDWLCLLICCELALMFYLRTKRSA